MEEKTPQKTSAPVEGEIVSPQEQSSKSLEYQDICAIISLVLGIINLCSWFLPICGCPLAIIGIILGIVGIKSDKKTLAFIGIGLSVLGFIATIINSAAGVILYSGQ